jgi:hypothetical protein
MIGLQQYQRLGVAIGFYEKRGFRPLDVPWAVSREAMDITRPTWAGATTMMYNAGGNDLCPVASAEQSFLQMQMDAIDRGQRMDGSYVAMTPCFRNEPIIDDLHQPYFMKVELISFDKTGPAALDGMIERAQEFFEIWVDTEIIPNTDPDPIGEIALDIVGKHSKLELGSYGLREHPRVGRWLYGTGVAEPRLSHVIDMESLY